MAFYFLIQRARNKEQGVRSTEVRGNVKRASNDNEMME